MTRMFAKLLILVAVLLMPLGMAPAASAPVPQHRAGMPMNHCPEQAPSHETKGAFAECTMACSAALPAVDAPSDEPLRIVCTPDRPEVVQRLHGLHPETATPPPKRS